MGGVARAMLGARSSVKITLRDLANRASGVSGIRDYFTREVGLQCDVSHVTLQDMIFGIAKRVKSTCSKNYNAEICV